jgi:hypothetical protein
MTSSEPKKNIWNIVVPIMVILLIVFIVGISYLFWSNMNEPSYSLVINELKDGDAIQPINYYTENYTIGQKYEVTPLSEDDFKVFPILASIIRDKTQKPIYVDDEGRGTYHIPFWEDGHSAFTSRFGLSGGLEYKGKRYNFAFMHVD